MNTDLVEHPFKLFWSVVREESKKLHHIRILKKVCVSDKRILKNNSEVTRSVYLYKLSPVLITLVATCVGRFFKHQSKEEKLLFSEKTKICSLSNGPGIDIVGYLTSLYKHGVILNDFPTFNAINLYAEWEELFHKVISNAHQDYSSMSKGKSMNLPNKNIQFLCCDLFEAISIEAETFIKGCDILLMLNCFSGYKSSKVSTKLQRIFTLLKPGATVFFIDGKEKINLISEAMTLNLDINIIHTPEPVAVRRLTFDDYISRKIDVEPLDSFTASFIVLQKKPEPHNKDNLIKILEDKKQTESKQLNLNKIENEVPSPPLPSATRNLPPPRRLRLVDTFTLLSYMIPEKAVNTEN